MRRCCGVMLLLLLKSAPTGRILIDKFLENAIEAEADAIADGKDAYCSSRDGAHRTGGRSFRRLGLRDSAGKHSRTGTLKQFMTTQENSHRTERGRFDEYPICHRQRYRLHPGGQSPGLPHRSAGFQGLQHFHGADSDTTHARAKS